MVKSKNIFFIGLLPKIVIVSVPTYGVFAINILSKKKKTKLKFLNKSSKKSVLINPCQQVSSVFINYNKSIQYNVGIFNFIMKKVVFLLKYKLKWNFKKFKYHGKGYKIKKFNKLSKITFRFGKSHWTKVIYNRKLLLVKRTKKNAYCCITIKNNLFINFKTLIRQIKGVNKYTKRGVRLTRQLLKKRFGKISQASSVYK